MANRFYRRPVIGSDENNWAQYNDAHILEAIGECNVTVYDNAGTLTISKGRIGINDGTHEGVCILDTNSTPDTSGVAASHWAEVYMTVSGANVTFTVLQMADTDDWTIPSTFKNAYDYEKGGYYINSARRCIALIWIDSNGDLNGIINVLNNCEGYNGYTYKDDFGDALQNKKIWWDIKKNVFKKWIDFDIGSWDMDADAFTVIRTGIDKTYLRVTEVYIIGDTGIDWSSLVHGGYVRYYTLGLSADRIHLIRNVGGPYDSINFDDNTINRGYVRIEVTEEP